MAPYMHLDVSAISAQGRIEGRAKVGHGGPHLKKNVFLAQKATAAKRMHSNDLEACGMKLCCFWFHSDVKSDAFIVLRWATVALWASCSFRSKKKKKQDGRPGIGFAETFITFSLKPLKRIQRILTGSKISTFSTKFVFFRLIGKTRWSPCSLICCHIFDFSSEIAERNSTKLDKKQALNVL